jgi:hypothetical protein
MHQSAVRASSAGKQIRACFRNRQIRFVHRDAAFSACAIQRELICAVTCGKKNGAFTA